VERRRRRQGNRRARELALACALALAAAAPVAASPAQETIVMDDPQVVHGSDEQVERAFRTFAQLGVDRVRVSVLWHLVAPSPDTRERPAFDASDPAAYAPVAWDRYDRIVRAAREHGLALLFTVTGPSPLWATAPAPRVSLERTWMPSAAELQGFVTALGTRYSGSYRDEAPGPPGDPGFLGFGGTPAPAGEPLPRVDAWSVWNEPNHSGWLTPQWRRTGGRGFQASPGAYRALVDAAWAGLGSSGHGGDLFLLGETAPRGWRGRKAISGLRPLEFVRELYCLDPGGRPYRGGAAQARGCPPSGAGFADAHPALFAASGFAHHAYGFSAAPSRARAAHRDEVQLADLSRLTATLDRAFARWGQARRLPVWITEYGYETNPPDRRGGVSWARQAAYLDEAAYLAYRNPRVASIAQFLLYDDLPWARFPPGDHRHWGTLQSGLLTADGTAKPSFASFRAPVHVARSRRGRLVVFGQLRRPGGPVSARLELVGAQSAGGPVATATTTDPRGFVTLSVRARRRGAYRIVFTDPVTGAEVSSRAAAVPRTR
jgi:hypothetical protein